MKRRVPFEGAHVAWKEPEPNRAPAIAVIDAIDQRRQFLAPVIVAREQVRLMLIGGHQVEQHHADGEGLVPRNLFPELLKAGEQKPRVARLVKIGFVQPAAEIADPGQMHA